MATLKEIQDALASQINVELGSGGTADPVIDNLQVTGRMNTDPTPPSIDIYPADPFQERLAMGPGNNTIRLTVRARVHTADHVGGQDMLLDLMDPGASTSLTQAIASDRTLGGKISKLSIEGPSGLGLYTDAGGQGSLMGATWTVTVYP